MTWHTEPRFAFPNTGTLAEAVAKAKASLPRFRAALEDGRCAGSFPGVKIHFPRPDGGEGQHVGLAVNSYFANLYFCTPFELPTDFVGLRMGESKLATDDDIEDWMVLVGGVVDGGYSLRAIRAELSAGERARFDAYIGLSRYAPEEVEPCSVLSSDDS